MPHTSFNPDHSWFKQLYELSPDPTWIIDGNRFVECNEAAVRALGYPSRKDFLSAHPSKLSPPRQPDGEDSYTKADRMMAIALDQGLHRFEWIHTRANGENFVAEVTLSAIELLDRKVLHCVWRDITERKMTEARAHQLSNLYAALSQCNKASAHSKNEVELFPQVCRIAVQFGGAKVAWIGITDAESGMVRPVASFGDDGGFVKDFQISIDAGNPQGAGPTGTAIREDRPVWVQDLLNDPIVAPWRHIVLRYKLGSTASLPLHRNGAVIGAFVLYSGEANAFDQSVRNLLVEMATDISFALDNFARESQRRRAENELRAAEEQFRGLVEQGVAGIYIIQDGKLAYANPRFAEIAGRGSADELAGSDPLGWIVESDRDKIQETMRGLFEGKLRSVSHEFGIQRGDGEVIQIGAHSSRATFEGRPAIIGLLQDISEKKRAEEQIQHHVEQLKIAFMSTVEVATVLSELRDPYTAGHERRVAEISVAISAELGFDENRQEGLRVAGFLHDIGKISIPAEILSRPGKLSAIEYQLIQEHPQSGFDVLKSVKFPWPVALVALQHHERIDGSGYPQGLKGEEILLEARIVAVADVVEAMSSHRPYRAGLGIEKALAEIGRGRGTAYDADVAEACLRLFRDKGYEIPS